MYMPFDELLKNELKGCPKGKKCCLKQLFWFFHDHVTFIAKNEILWFN